MTKLPTIIWRHKRENLKKCSLKGLESRDDIQFFTYPGERLPDLSNYVLLSMEGPTLSEEDRDKGLFLIDGTWRYAERMLEQLPRCCQEMPVTLRSLPQRLRTAYPRRQEDCVDPSRGLASVEALFLAYHLSGRETEGLLDYYYWKEAFLEINQLDINSLSSYNFIHD